MKKTRNYFTGKFLIFGLLILAAQSMLAQGSLDSGLVAYWPFSRSANDSTGHGHNGVVIGATLTQDRFARDSMAYDFNGTLANYIEVADDDAWAFGLQPFTILLWANFRVVSQYFLIGQTGGGGSTNKWMIQYEAGFLRFHINSPQTGPLYPVYFPWSPLVNHWYQIAVTRSGDQYRLYVDSVQVASNLDTHAVRNTNAPLHIGKTEGRGFNGRLDDVRIYNRALTAQEISSLFSGGLTGVETVSTETPESYKLYQNYPNPFNPVTIIKFEIPNLKYETNSKTEIRVYDVLGNELSVLISEELKPGTYEVEWDASNYPSGVYYCRLTVRQAGSSIGDYSETKKMALVK